MTDQELMKIFLERLGAKKAQRDAYESLKTMNSSGERYEAAVKFTAARLKDASSYEPFGAGEKLLDGLTNYHKYLPTDGDFTNDMLRSLIEKAATDFYAFKVLELVSLVMTNRSGFSNLRKWEMARHLGLFVAPKRPPGRRPHAKMHRDTLIVRTIESLVANGFQATRNKSEGGGSACDIVAEALEIAQQGISYDAVESVWTRRNSLPSPKILGAAFSKLLTNKGPY